MMRLKLHQHAVFARQMPRAYRHEHDARLLHPFVDPVGPMLVAIDQQGHGQRQVSREGDLVAWTSELPNGSHALAFFNLGEEPLTVMSKPFASYGLTQYKSYRVRDVWSEKDLGLVEDGVSKRAVPPHGCVLYVISR